MTSSKDYWAARERAQQEANKKLDAKFDKELKKIYDTALINIRQEIDAFYGRYATKEGISLAEAKKRVSQADIKAYEAKAKEYVTNRTFTEQANEEMRLYNLTMKVNRLEMLKSRIGMELAAKYSDMERKAAKHLQSGAEDEFKRMAGILGKSVPDVKKAASTIPGASFHNATYSERIWTNQRALKSEIDKLLQEGMIQGRNPRAIAPQLQRAFGVSKVASERLMRTEMCRVQIEAQRQSYDENGVDEYEYMAHTGCCEICAAMNGKVFKVKKMIVGDNAPPMHPNCRCGTVPHMDMEAYEEWLDGYKDHGLDFEEWKKVKPYADNILMKARTVEPKVTSALKDAVSTTDAHLEGLDHRIKGKSSLIRKLATKSKAKGLTVEEYAGKVTDVLRYTSVSGVDSFTDNYFRIIESLKEKGYNEIEVRNTLKDRDADYRGINTLIQTADGYVFELQYHTPESLKIKEINHKLYEEQRLPRTSKKRRQELNDQMIRNASKIKTPPGSERIKDMERSS